MIIIDSLLKTRSLLSLERCSRTLPVRRLFRRASGRLHSGFTAKTTSGPEQVDVAGSTPQGKTRRPRERHGRLHESHAS
jgi:hypothetical protein